MAVQARGPRRIVTERATMMAARSATTVAPPARAADDSGMTTAEYAVGTVAACGFAGILFKLLTSDLVRNLLFDVIKRALSAAF